MNSTSTAIKPTASTLISSTSTPSASPPPSTSKSSTSLWDRLPTEIKEQVLNETDPPTRFLNHQILTKSEIEQYGYDIWIAVINTKSWNCNLSSLPHHSFPTIVNGLDRVTSPDAYHQLCKARSDLAGLEYLQQLFDTEDFWLIYFTEELLYEITSGWHSTRCKIFDEHNMIPQLLINIPMRHFWKDELTEAFKHLDPLKLLFVAGSCGHFDLFQHLYNDIFINHPLQVKTSPSVVSKIHLLKMYRYIMLSASERGFTTIIQFLLTAFNINNINITWKYIDYIVLAAKNGHVNAVNLLVQHADDKAASKYNDVLIAATTTGRLEVVKFLVQLKGVDPTASYNLAIRRASSNGHFNIVKFMMTIPGIDVTSGVVFQDAISKASKEDIQMLMEIGCGNINASRFSNEFLPLAATLGRLDIVEMFLEVSGVDATAKNNHALRNAVPGVDASANGNEALLSALKEGHVEVVKLLLNVPGVDVTVDHNRALRQMGAEGHVDVVKLLLNIPGVDASARDNDALKKAASKGHVEVVKLLLDVPGVYATAGDNAALGMAAAEGHVEVVRLLLNVRGVDASAHNNEAIRLAARGGKLEIVKLLSAVPGVDVTANDNEALKLSASKGHARVVKFLLGLPEVDATAENNFAVKEAAKEGHLGVVMLLADVPGVDLTETLFLAAERQHFYVVLLVLGDERYCQNEFLKMVATVGAEVFVSMFGEYSWNIDENTLKVRRQQVLNTLETKYAGLQSH
ncbi:hypothetical protein HDU76_000229 [Blyttiomyces sp. JEL0837]|nr:hypothetical protein HDU76_000229 [Blyttiomyces sp. JEL0837]